MNNIVLQVFKVLIQATFVILVSYETIEDQYEMVPLPKEPVLMNDAGLVLKEGENRKLIVEQDFALVVV